MKTEKVTAEYAAGFMQEKKFGIISEGCNGVWGEGSSIEDALADAKRNQQEYAGAVDLSDCYIMEIE